MEDKLAVVKALCESDFDVWKALLEYKLYYDDLGRQDITKVAELGLAEILMYAVSGKTIPGSVFINEG
jgi:hypothetical protein